MFRGAYIMDYLKQIFWFNAISKNLWKDGKKQNNNNNNNKNDENNFLLILSENRFICKRSATERAYTSRSKFCVDLI
jgi:hypothetical protein